MNIIDKTKNDDLLNDFLLINGELKDSNKQKIGRSQHRVFKQVSKNFSKLMLVNTQEKGKNLSLREVVDIFNTTLQKKEVGSQELKPLCKTLNRLILKHNNKSLKRFRITRWFWGLFGYDYQLINKIQITTTTSCKAYYQLGRFYKEIDCQKAI